MKEGLQILKKEQETLWFSESKKRAIASGEGVDMNPSASRQGIGNLLNLGGLLLFREG